MAADSVEKMSIPDSSRSLPHSLSESGESEVRGLSALLRKALQDSLMRDSFNYLVSKVVPGVMGLLSVMVFVRLVGYEEYGRYAVLYAGAIAFSGGLSGWLSQGILRFQSKYDKPADLQVFQRVIHSGAILSTAIGGAALVVILLLTGARSANAIALSVGFFAAVLAYAITITGFQASLRSMAVVRLETIRSLAAFVIPVVLVWIVGPRDHRLLLLGILLGYLVPLIGYGVSGLKGTGSHMGSWRVSLLPGERMLLREMWGYGWPVALWVLCQQGLVVSDRYFIQSHSGYSDAGVYASMYDTVVRSFSLLFMPITLAVHTLVMNRWNTGARRESLSILQAGASYQFALFLPIGMGMLLAGPTITRLVLGRENLQAQAVVLPLALGAFLWQVALLAHKPLEILCQTKRMLGGILAALAVNMTGNWLLIPRYGYRASAYLTVASSLVYLLMLFALTPVRELRRQASLADLAVLPGGASAQQVGHD